MNLVDVSPPGVSVSWRPMEGKVCICIFSPQSQQHCRQSWTVEDHLSQLSARSRLPSHISQPGKYTHYAPRIILLPLLLWCCTVYNSHIFPWLFIIHHFEAVLSCSSIGCHKRKEMHNFQFWTGKWSFIYRRYSIAGCVTMWQSR